MSARTAGVPDAYSAALDIGDEAAVVSALMKVTEQFGTPSVIVNNAGALDFKPIAELTVEDWLKILRVDLLGGFVFIREAFRLMKHGGSIINVASIHAIETTPNVAPYCGGKSSHAFPNTLSIDGGEKPWNPGECDPARCY